MTLLRSAWKFLVAIKDGLVLLALLLFFGALYAAMSFSPTAGELRGGALYLPLDGVIVDQKVEEDPLAMLSGSSDSVGQVQLRDVVHALRTAATDDDIKAVVLDLDAFMGGGQVSLHSIAEAMAEVRKAKKPILTYATGYADDGYALAAQASEVWLDPMGGVLIAGPGGTQPYFKGLLDRFDVNVHVYRAGKFKSFVEPFLLEGQSDEAREANQALADALWTDWKALVSKGRAKAKIDAVSQDPVGLLKASGGNLSQMALDNGLVDKLGDPVAFGRRVAEIVGGDEDAAPGYFERSDFEAYLAANPPETGGDPIAVVHVSGDIVDGTAGPGSAGGDSVAALIDSAVQDLDAKAIVLRIDSPGGSAMASERIRLAAMEARKAKVPVVVSMGNVAASGGYWVAMAGEKIFAEPSTITGSIGVFGVVPTFEKTLARYGVNSDGVKTTELSGQPDILGGINDTGDAMLQTAVEDIYRRFTGLVATTRKLPQARVDEIAQGRVWAGGDARQLGLIDAFGSLDDAIADAAKRAGLEMADVAIIHVDEEPDWFSSLFSARATARPAARDFASRILAIRQGEAAAMMRDALRVASGPAVQVRCMACPSSAPVAPPRAETWINRIFN